jgi:aminoglycoside phosphotransferase (APT) family kinase protein
MPNLAQQRANSAVICDPGIPTLKSVLDATKLREHLRQSLRWDVVEQVRVKNLKHHPGSRCTVDLALQTAKGWDSFVGKVYAVDRLDVYRTMNEISQAGFSPQDAFSIPRPVAYVSELQLLLQEKVEGLRAKEVFLTAGQGELVDAAERCARWLVKFHNQGARSGEVFKARNQIPSVARWAARITDLGEPCAAMAKRLSALIQARVAGLEENLMCAGHGSYNCNQIILSKERTVALDWDTYDVADPCRDVARFIVALQRLALKYLGSVRALDSTAEAFLHTYDALSPFTIAANLPWHRAFTCLKLAKYEANRPVCTFRHGIEALLAEGLRALNG